MILKIGKLEEERKSLVFPMNVKRKSTWCIIIEDSPTCRTYLSNSTERATAVEANREIMMETSSDPPVIQDCSHSTATYGASSTSPDEWWPILIRFRWSSVVEGASDRWRLDKPLKEIVWVWIRWSMYVSESESLPPPDEE